MAFGKRCEKSNNEQWGIFYNLVYFRFIFFVAMYFGLKMGPPGFKCRTNNENTIIWTISGIHNGP